MNYYYYLHLFLIYHKYSIIIIIITKRIEKYIIFWILSDPVYLIKLSFFIFLIPIEEKSLLYVLDCTDEESELVSSYNLILLFAIFSELLFSVSFVLIYSIFW